jgi:hypothetical protein
MNPDTPPVISADADSEQLRLLSVFHYVVAGITALFSLFPLIHLSFGVAMLAGWLDDSGDRSEQAVAGLFFIAIALVMITVGMVLAGLIAWSGRQLARRQRHMFCTVVAAIACILMPFGTVLGVFTLIVLMRPSVKAAFTS